MDVDQFMRVYQVEIPSEGQLKEAVQRQVHERLDEYKRNNHLDMTIERRILRAAPLDAMLMLDLLDFHPREAALLAVEQLEKETTWYQGPLAEWEKAHQMEDSSRLMRKAFVEMAQEKNVPRDWLEDSKKRWENQEFSSVSKGWVVIGDVYAPNLVYLPVKSEVDLAMLKGSDGRESATYENWPGIRPNISAVRPKINGERFVFKRSGTSGQFVGFRTYEVPRNWRFELVEYYAGKFYSLFPVLQSPEEVVVRVKGVEKRLTMLPHPFMPASTFHAMYVSFCTHKYDGLMLWDDVKKKEWRTKWNPSTETYVGEEVWEVDSNGKKIRPRYGKAPALAINVAMKLAEELRTYSVMQQLPKTYSPPDVFSVTRRGAKVFLLDGLDVVGIREENKPWDLVGGQCELGETFDDALIREIAEETGAAVSQKDLIFLGVSEDLSGAIQWETAVYVARDVKWGEKYKKTREAVRVAPGSSQVWVKRLWNFFECFGGVSAKGYLTWKFDNGKEENFPPLLLQADRFNLVCDGRRLTEQKGLSEVIYKSTIGEKSSPTKNEFQQFNMLTSFSREEASARLMAAGMGHILNVCSVLPLLILSPMSLSEVFQLCRSVLPVRITKSELTSALAESDRIGKNYFGLYAPKASGLKHH